MSKIARIYQGTNEIQKYYQGGVLQRLFFDWKHYIGNELNIEYAKECAGRNVVISGKTYQNLFKAELSQGHVNSSLTAQQNLRVNSEGFNLSAKKFTISVSAGFEVLVYPNYVNSASVYVLWANKIVWNNNSESNNIRIMVKKTDNSEITVDEVIGKVILLEGDYTNTDLPTSIDGIESVAEREIEDNNLISEMIVGWCNIATGNVEGCPESWPNSKVSNLIEINPNIKYKSNILSRAIGETTGPDNLRIRCFDENKNYVRFTTEEAQWLCDFNDFYNHKDIYKSIKYIRILVLDSSLEVEEPYVVKENINRFTYPVTIRNYNYKCETDNIILPNGVKNSIDTIDGKKVHTRRVGAVLLKGTQDMTLSNVNQTLTTRVRIRMNNAKVSKNNLLCNWFIRTGVHGDYEYIIIQDSSEGICLFISVLNTKLSAPTADGVKQYFSENPLWVFYELATPIYTYLESGIYDDITIPTSGIKNEIYSENGKWYHKRNIGKVIFDGSSDENWNYEETFKRFNSPDINDCIYKNGRTPVCIKGYTYNETSGVNFDTLAFLSGAYNGCKLYIYNYAYTSVEDFREYLAENPLEVYYELAEPVISELYFTDITYKLNEPLRSLPDGICDTIEEGKIVKRVEKVIVKSLDNLNVILQEANNNRIGIKIGNENNSSVRQPIISDNFFDLSSGASNTSGGAFLGGGRLYLTLGLSTIDEYNEWFNNNPTIFYYQLKTPIETEITPNMILINGEPITDTVGIELPNGIKDSIENDCYVKRVGKVILDGSDDEKWEIERTTNNLMNAGILIESVWNKSRDDIESGKIDYYFFSDKLPNQCTGIASTTTEGIMLHLRCVYVRILLSKLSSQDINGLRNYLSENPVTVWYELATPVKIPLFSIKEGLTILKSTNNITPEMELDCLVRDDFQNLCDNTWVNGDIDVSSGVEYSSSSSRIKLQDYIDVQPNTTYYCDTFSETVYSTTGKVGVRYYKNDKTYISGGGIGIAKTSYNKFTTPEDCYYIKFIVETLDTNYKMYLRPVK